MIEAQNGSGNLGALKCLAGLRREFSQSTMVEESKELLQESIDETMSNLWGQTEIVDQSARVSGILSTFQEGAYNQLDAEIVEDTIHRVEARAVEMEKRTSVLGNLDELSRMGWLASSDKEPTPLAQQYLNDAFDDVARRIASLDGNPWDR